MRIQKSVPIKSKCTGVLLSLWGHLAHAHTRIAMDTIKNAINNAINIQVKLKKYFAKVNVFQ